MALSSTSQLITSGLPSTSMPSRECSRSRSKAIVSPPAPFGPILWCTSPISRSIPNTGLDPSWKRDSAPWPQCRCSGLMPRWVRSRSRDSKSRRSPIDRLSCSRLLASNQELGRALDAQTATSDILRVINRSHTGAQPVFDTIVDSAVRVLRGHTGALTRITGEQLDLAAATRVDDASDATLRATFPRLLGSEWPHAHAIRDHVPLNIADAQTDPRVPDAGHAEARVR